MGALRIKGRNILKMDSIHPIPVLQIRIQPFVKMKDFYYSIKWLFS